MEYKRRDYFITFTMLGLSAAALMAYQYAGALLFGLAETWAKSQETGVFRWFSWLFDSPWTAVLVKYLFVIGGAYPIIALLLCRVPKFKGKLQLCPWRPFSCVSSLPWGPGTFLIFWAIW